MKISDLKNYTVVNAPSTSSTQQKVNGPNQSNPSNPFSPFPENGGESYGQSVAKSFGSGIDQIKSGLTAPTAGNGNFGLQSLEGGLKIGAGAVGAAFSPIAPVLDATLGKTIETAGKGYATLPAVQKFANSSAGKTTARVAEDVSNATTIAGAVAGGVETPRVANTIGDNVSRATTKVPKGPGGSGAGFVGTTKSAIRDVVPTTQRWINHQVSLALDLAPGDLNKISRSTGNDVGTFMSEHNLIGTNKATTHELLSDFFDKNYKEVRSDIGKVTTTFKQYQVPRYVDALKQIQSKVADIPGLERTQAEVSNLLAKQDIQLTDVQRVKELLDEHFNLYKQTGDVGEGVVKEGLANLRGDLKSFIEQQVKDATGKDISIQNNNVATARAISDVMKTRDPKGLTRANVTMRDAAAFFFGSSFAGPLGGIAAVFVKKIYESPSIRLLIARGLDQMSDVRKAKIKSDLEAGKIDPELIQMIREKPPEQSQPQSIPSPSTNGSTLMDKAKGVMNTVKTEGKRGFAKIGPDNSAKVAQLKDSLRIAENMIDRTDDKTAKIRYAKQRDSLKLQIRELQ